MPDDPLPPPPRARLNAEGLIALGMQTTFGTQWTPPPIGELQRALPAYDILSTAGRGGMGAVYRARQKRLDRLVAIKVLPAEIEHDEAGYAERFEREAKAMARLSHPNIVAVHDAGETSDGLLYFVMDFVDGTDVQRMLAERGRLPLDQALTIAGHVLDALAFAHGKGIIHRDIKPSNVLIDADGYVKVADFGLAKVTSAESSLLTASDLAMGTPAYMAPEAFAGAANLDQRADLYAVGVMLYQMLTGDLPHGVFDPPSTKVRCERRVDEIIRRALQADPARRFTCALEMRAALEPVLTRSRRIIAGRAGKKSRRPLLIAATAVVTLALAFTVDRAFRARPRVATPLREVTAPQSDAATATKDAPFVNSLGMRFVPVPITGGPTSGQRVLFSIWETRVQDYQQFAAEKRLAWPKPDAEQGATHPPVSVTWDDAKLFCAWLTQRERAADKLGPADEYRLPTDHEWSCAVGIGERENATALPADKDRILAGIFPWGSVWPPPEGTGNYWSEELRPLLAAGKFNYIRGGELTGYRDGFATTAPVGSYAPNRFGLYDLSGNAWEWCVDWTDARHVERVWRGGAWGIYDQSNLLSSRRSHHQPDDAGYDVGFRVVLAHATSVVSGEGSAQRVDATFATATKDAPFMNSLGMKFVPVPLIGGSTNGQRVLFSIWETRVQDYEMFARETKRQWPTPDAELGPTHPAVGMSWNDAAAYCAWLTERERKAGKLANDLAFRLPSDHEWSCAVGIGEREDATKLPGTKNKAIPGVYPWGSVWPPPNYSGNYWSEELRPLLATGKYESISKKDECPGYKDGYPTTAPVGSYAANALGIYDLGGNVQEWCEDWQDEKRVDRVRRGVSWRHGRPDTLLSSMREGHRPDDDHPDNRMNGVGFRIVLAQVASALRADEPTQGANAETAWHPPAGPPGLVKTYDFHPASNFILVDNDRRLLIRDEEHGVNLLDLATGERRWSQPPRYSNVFAALPGGARAVSAGVFGPEIGVTLVKIADGAELASWSVPDAIKLSLVKMEVSPDGRRMAVAYAGGEGAARRLSVWVLTTDRLQLVAQWAPQPVQNLYDVLWLDNDSLLVSCDDETHLLSYDLRRAGQPPVPHPLHLWVSVAADPARERIAGSHQGDLIITELLHPERAMVLNAGSMARQVRFAGGDWVLAAIDKDNTLALYDAHNGKVLAEWHYTGHFEDLTVSHDATFAFAKSGDPGGVRTLTLWRLRDLRAEVK